MTKLLQILCPVLLPKLAKGHSLWSESCYSFLESIQQLYPNQAFLVQNALLCILGKNSEG
jgi:hypothetical protein